VRHQLGQAITANVLSWNFTASIITRNASLLETYSGLHSPFNPKSISIEAFSIVELCLVLFVSNVQKGINSVIS